MSFKLVKYKEPDFSQSQFTDAPDAVTAPAPKDKVAPEHYHATTISRSILRLRASGCWQKRAVWTAWQCTRMGRFMSGSLGT